jgi:hypothetical protein
MKKYGNITLMGGGQVQNFRPDNVTIDPVSPHIGQMWFNTAEGPNGSLKYFDGNQVWPIAKGGDLANYLRLDGTVDMTADLKLSSLDQSESGPTAATSKGHVDAALSKKEDVLTGAASTIAQVNLASSKALVSGAAGKVEVSEASSAQVGYLRTTTSDVQIQIDSKQSNLGFTPLDTAGSQGGMQVDLSMNGNQVVGLKAASDPTSPVRLAEFDSFAAGFNWQEDVKAVQSDASLDPGVAPAKGDRYIIQDQDNLHANFGVIVDLGNNDIVEFNGDSFAVAFDYDTVTNAEGAMVWNLEASQNYRIVGIAWAPFFGLDSLVPGLGLSKTGNTFDINLGAGLSETSLDEVGLDYSSTGGLWTHVGGEESNDSLAKLAVKLNGSSLETTSSGLAIKAGGIDSTHINPTALGGGLQGGAGVPVSVKTSLGLSIGELGLSLDLEFGDARYANLAGDTYTGPVRGIAPIGNSDLTRKDYVDQAVDTNTQAIAALTSRVGAGHWVYDGSLESSESHVVTHGFANKFVNVQVVDTDDEVILPDSIKFTDANTVIVTFTTAITCRVIITGANLS